MMREMMLAAAALAAGPVSAQDHAGHAGQEHTTRDQHAHHGGQDEERVNDHSPEAEVDHPAMDHSAMDHSAMGHDDPPADIPAGPPPPRAFAGPVHAAELFFPPERMAAARSYNHAIHGDMTTGTVLAERFETRLSDGHDAYLWDATGWYGGALDKFVLKTEGEGGFGEAVEEAELQLLWGRAIGPFIDLQLGVRIDIEPATTAKLAVGVAGLAPYMVHFDAAMFLSENGDLTARIEAEHDVRLTQRLILQPRIETELSAQRIPRLRTGSGLSTIELGARLRYEFVPEFAPYVGIGYEAATGGTADFIRAGGEDPDGVSVLAGLRFWY